MHPVDQYFDSIFLINLDRRPDRWTEAQAELALCGIKRCVRRAGIDHPLGGNHGCTATHRQLWREIGTGQHGTRVLIFEDDFTFTTRAILAQAGYGPTSDVMRIFNACPGDTLTERFSMMLPYVPKVWDRLYLGGGYECAPMMRVNKYVIRDRGMQTTHAYAISQAYGARITRELDARWAPDEYPGPVDVLLYNRAKSDDLHSYVLTPRLFIQRPGQRSDLNPQPPGFPFSMTDPAHEMMV